jgi:hypothetical protein
MEYSAMKKNEIILIIGKWMKLEIVMLGEVNQVHKDKVCSFLSYVEDRLKDKWRYKYEHDHIYIYRQHISNNGTD